MFGAIDLETSGEARIFILFLQVPPFENFCWKERRSERKILACLSPAPRGEFQNLVKEKILS